MKRWLCFVLAGVLLLYCAACDVKTPHTPVTDFEYEENSSGITITKYIGSANEVVIPKIINGIPVKQIGYNAFFMNEDIVSVSLPDTITKIGNNAFDHCPSLMTVTLSSTLETIGGCAFQNCEKLTTIVLPKSLKTISPQAFKGCTSLKQLTVSKDLIIGFEAFHNTGLESILFEEGVTAIPDTCFAGTKIREVILPKTVKNVDRQAFAGCENLEKVVLNEGLETVGDLAFYGAGKLKEIVIPSTVTAIKETTFSNCSLLGKVKFAGDAPDDFLRILQGTHFGAENVHFTIFYHKDAKGFTSPEWNGYSTEIW